MSKHDYDSEENRLQDLKIIRDNERRKLRTVLIKLTDFTHETLCKYNATPDEWEHFRVIIGDYK